MRSLVLTVAEGPNAGRSASTGKSLVVGRGSQADFSVMDPRMSRAHFEIVIDEDSWQLRDLGSSNGTSINNQQAAEAMLQPGDVILAGDTKLRVDIGENGGLSHQS